MSDAAKAGRELDALVAHKVFGWDKAILSIPASDHDDLERAGVSVLPFYSTNIAAAWLVVEEMKRRGWLFHILEMVEGFVVNGREYEVPNGKWSAAMFRNGFVQEPGETAPESICLAALAACGMGGVARDEEVKRTAELIFAEYDGLMKRLAEGAK